MIGVLKSSWALLLGMMMLMVGNGLQGTLLGVRGAVEGFSANTMAFVMSGYFLGFLLGSRMTPDLIRRVGHVRVFAALASLVSACFILFAAAPVPWVWAMLRVVVGLCFSGIYVVAESWLNESTPNETRGQALSLYLIVQMLGIIAGATAAQRRRSRRLPAVRDHVGAGLDLLRADPLVGLACAGLRLDQADVAGAALLGLAAGHGGHLRAGRDLCRAVRHGLGLFHRGWAQRRADLDLHRYDLYRGTGVPVPDRLDFGQDGPPPPDHAGHCRRRVGAGSGLPCSWAISPCCAPSPS